MNSEELRAKLIQAVSEVAVVQHAIAAHGGEQGEDDA
jgi:hypothetical protein